MPDRGKYVEIDITFECENGHEIARNFTHFQSPGGHRIIEKQAFEMLECPKCGWKGTKRGSQAKRMKAR